jgi:hypothetical protein
MLDLVDEVYRFYEREKRQAPDMWGEHVMALVEGRANTVVALHAG